jgi:GMP synthase-like glutamine amidotransferase
MHFLVFQHIPVEHPGIFRDFMTKDGITWDTIELDEGDSIPELDNYDALIVMGGPMDVWEEDKHPWLITEKEAIRKAIVDFKLPYLGFCLGHQLMADALGGKVSKMPESEVGILNIELTGDGRNASIFSGLQKKSQKHHQEVGFLQNLRFALYRHYNMVTRHLVSNVM